jgi:hypothetical protein
VTVDGWLSINVTPSRFGREPGVIRQDRGDSCLVNKPMTAVRSVAYSPKARIAQGLGDVVELRLAKAVQVV